MTKILVPIDFSDVSRPVLEEACHLAKDLKAHLVLLHVVEPVTQFVGGEAAFDMIQPPMPLETKQPKHQLDDIAREVRDKGVEASVVLEVGLAVDEILNHADKHSIKYIMVGSHGHGALYHLFAGSVVTGVLKSAKCPVIVVPAPQNS